MARNLVECVVERGEGPFDAEWMVATQDRFWKRHRYIEKFNSTLLEPLTEAGQMLLIAQYGSTAKPGDKSPQQRIANAFINNFNDPILLTDAFHDKDKARQVVKEAFGSSFWPLLQGRAKIAKGQIRQKVGLSAGHPGT